MDKLTEGLIDLRFRVENPNKEADLIISRAGMFKHTHGTLLKLTQGPWVFGYQIKENPMRKIIKPGTAPNIIFTRFIYIKNTEQKLKEIPEEEKDELVEKVFETMLDKQSDMPGIGQISPFCICIRQQFEVCILAQTGSPVSFVPGGMANA